MWVLAVESFVVVVCFVDGSAVRPGAATCSAVVEEEIRPFEKGGDAPLRGGTSRTCGCGGEGWMECVCVFVVMCSKK